MLVPQNVKIEPAIKKSKIYKQIAECKQEEHVTPIDSQWKSTLGDIGV